MLSCVSLSIFLVQLNLHLISMSFLDTIFFAGISFPLLFRYPWPDPWASLCLFIIQVGLLIGHFLKSGLFFDSCTAVSTLSIRSFIKELTSSIVSSVRISLIMVLNHSDSIETGLSGKSERKLISLSSSTMIAVSSETSAFLLNSASSTSLSLLF